jgi:hypothetical protein
LNGVVLSGAVWSPADPQQQTTIVITGPGEFYEYAKGGADSPLPDSSPSRQRAAEMQSYRAEALSEGIASRRNIESTSSTAIRIFPLPHHINSPNKPPPMNCETASMGVSFAFSAQVP